MTRISTKIVSTALVSGALALSGAASMIFTLEAA